MTNIRNYIRSKLLTPLKSYPTPIQETLLEIITSRLEEIYVLTKRFPEIIGTTNNRLDIINTIAEQFNFELRDEANIKEQLAILENILHLYRKRGSIDTIEHLWKYYGGDLPHDLTISIPSYNIFRYNLSSFSGEHVFQDGGTNRSGAYEILLNNSNYPIPKLRDFLLKEVVAAGNRIYFTNNLYSLMYGEEASYKYDVMKDYFVDLQMNTSSYRSGMQWSGIGKLSDTSELSVWSGRPELFVELSSIYELGPVSLNDFYPRIIDILAVLPATMDVHYSISSTAEEVLFKEIYTDYTESVDESVIVKYSYDRTGNPIKSEFPGYFVTCSTLLGSEV